VLPSAHRATCPQLLSRRGSYFPPFLEARKVSEEEAVRPYTPLAQGPRERTIAPLDMIRASMACSLLPQRTPTPTGDIPAASDRRREAWSKVLQTRIGRLQRFAGRPLLWRAVGASPFCHCIRSYLRQGDGDPRNNPALFVVPPEAKTGMPSAASEAER
jgi:hypothetical protein